ncbi:pro-sigmaK processing inhibitor BofA family protein [Pseudoflavonifractor sp. An85]|uniref:pro-sigmaK processing inhibitor BofA family protein n=1 Tax=Pseudoflavonifractor sp. An85 TaxID=1965661 RepID=UPI000B380733|nr:pro-sigmaK processing inhibitor BofA family protein [Pseudoflavonifractor sp. An85]OUN24338.1 transcriptional regulator [Pseudoflavonifractor sp. An85]
MSWQVWMGLALGGLVLLAALAGPLRRLGRLLMRFGVGLAVLWGLQSVGPGLGISLGFNALNALVLGVLGAPGFGLLLLAQWVFR